MNVAPQVFSYDVDSETIGNCVGILMRAATRVANGESAFLGDRQSRFARNETLRAGTGRGGKFKMITPEFRQQVISTWESGKGYAETARICGCKRCTVEYIVKGLRRVLARKSYL